MQHETTEQDAQSDGSRIGNGSAARPHEAAHYIYAQISQWLELQITQSRIMERMLSLEERILDGAVVIASPAPADASPRLEPLASAVSLRPVLPAPSDGNGGPAAAWPSAGLSPFAPAPRAVVRPPIPIPSKAKLPAGPIVSTPQQQERPAEPPATAAPDESAGRVASIDEPPSDDFPETEEFRRDLLRAVSERTGYPIEMLDEDLPLESGLGIDSIKIVEIFSNLKRYSEFLQGAESDADEWLEEFSTVKTLRDIIKSYDERRRKSLLASANTTTSPGKAGAPDREAQVRRLALKGVEAPAPAGSKKKSSLRDS